MNEILTAGNGDLGGSARAGMMKRFGVILFWMKIDIFCAGENKHCRMEEIQDYVPVASGLLIRRSTHQRWIMVY